MLKHAFVITSISCWNILKKNLNVYAVLLLFLLQFLVNTVIDKVSKLKLVMFLYWYVFVFIHYLLLLFNKVSIKHG